MRRLMATLAAIALLVVGAGIVTAFGSLTGHPSLALMLGVLGTSVLIAMGPRLSRPVTVRRQRDHLD
jgi:hypothetical protein